MTNFQWRSATDSDRPFVAWMDELAETFEDESKPLSEDYIVTRRQYIDQWDASRGGVILFATSLDDADLESLSSDVTSTDPSKPRVFRETTYSTAATKAEWLECGDSSSSEGHESYEVPVGAAWLRMFTQDDPGYGLLENGIPEAVTALRPGVVGYRLPQPMITGFSEYAREPGYPGVSLVVHDANPRAMKAYVKVGLELVGRSSFPDHDVMAVRFQALRAQFLVGIARVGGVFKHWKRGSVSEKSSKSSAWGLCNIEWVYDNAGEGNQSAHLGI